MESQRFEHEHPLVFNEDASSNQQSEAANCSRCGEVMSGPSYSCAEAECEFHLHKECAEAPWQINHPFHTDHPLLLLPNPPAELEYNGKFRCTFCGETGEMFVYHCSCNIDLHIKCALFTYDFAQKNLGQLQGIAYKDPSPSSELESCKCLACLEPLLDSAYYSLDHGFNLHKKCVELPSEIIYPHHKEHPLILQFSVEKFPCTICFDINGFGFYYCCSLCDFVAHIACLSPLPSTLQGTCHQHPFTLFFRQMPFTCDACGVEGNSVPYLCLSCNLLVHKKCISLPPIIKFFMHEHPLFHCYSFERDDSESKNWDCVVCLDEVNTKYGGYYCLECHFVIHASCGTMDKGSYSKIESIDKFNEDRVLPEDSYIVVERNEREEATKIKHFSHEHNLVLSDKILEDDEFCDGCALIISSSFYHCSECDIFLHKKCVEFPKNKYLWFEGCGEPLILIAGCVFKCHYCSRTCNGFGYQCHKCGEYCCIGCTTPYTLTCEGHEHPVSYKYKHTGSCIGCGVQGGGLMCKICKITLCFGCCRLPSKVRDKCDKHLLALTCKDDHAYSEYNFCDTCEHARNPSYWFYSCATCDTSAHIECVLGRGLYSRIKSGKIYNEGNHSHPLRFVKKLYYYPECFECGIPCQRLALECTESGCEYIVHWECVCPADLSKV